MGDALTGEYKRGEIINHERRIKKRIGALCFNL